MTYNPIPITNVIKQQFPQIYQEDGENLIAFVEAYYEWFETSPYGQASNLINLRDIDATVDEFVVHFKNTYLVDLPSLTIGNVRNFIKHSSDFYNVRGTEAGIKLFFQLLYGVEASVYIPGDDILKLSDGTWVVPIYLEVSISDITPSFIGQQITGSSSGATAFVESFARKSTQGAYFDVLYLSNLEGNFVTGELITANGSLLNCPTIIGSLNNITIENGGANNIIGEIFNVTSEYGKQGLARITGITNATGRVNFDLEDGGSGYSLNAEALVSNTILLMSNVQNSNTSLSFEIFETIEQRLSNVAFLSSNGNFTVGQNVIGWTSGTWIPQATGTIVNVIQNGANGSLIIQTNSNYDNFYFADTLRTTGNTITALISLEANVSASGNVIGFTSNSIGIINQINSFYPGNNAYIYGLSTNTTANISSNSTGFGATFEIGSISDTETVYLNTDFLNGVNVANVPYKYIKLNGQGSGVGLVANVTIGQKLTIGTNNGTFAVNSYIYQTNSTAIIATGTVYAVNSTIISIYANSGTFTTANTVQANSTVNATITAINYDGGTGYVNNDIVTFNGGGESVATILIVATGQHYANGERLIFTSNTGYGATATVITNSTGNIVSFVMGSNGQYYSSPPIITANTSAGSGANLIAILNSSNAAIGNVSTNSSGGLAAINLTNLGSNYFGNVTSITIPHGSGANYQINQLFGYGFPKDPYGNQNTILNSLFTSEPITIGTINSLTGISPGQNYNEASFVLVIEPLVAGLNAQDFILELGNTTGVFQIGEVITQSFSAITPQLIYSGISGNTSFQVGELVTQGNTVGTVFYTDSTTIRLSNVSGIYINTTNTATKIIGNVTNATANVTNVSSFDLITTAKGFVKDYSNNVLYLLKRTSLFESFSSGGELIGVTSGATANIVAVEIDQNSLAMGNNAIITANVVTANGIATSAEIIDSGYSYKNQEVLTLTNNTNIFEITGIASVTNQGTGTGNWTTTKGFLDSDKYIQDDYYYQVFSYEIQTSISFDRYADIVKKILHISGTEVFGKTIIQSNIQNAPVSLVNSSINQEL